MNDEEWTTYQTERFYSSLMPYGSRDVYEAIKTVIQGGHEGDWLADKILEFCEDTGMKIEDIDVNFIAYESLLQEARGDIEELTDVDILNDLSDEIGIYPNYICTTLDYSEEAKEELLNLLKEVKEEDLTDAIKWLIEELN